MPFVSVIRSIPIIALNGELLHLHTYPPEIVTLVFECLLTIYLKLFKKKSKVPRTCYDIVTIEINQYKLLLSTT